MSVSLRPSQKRQFTSTNLHNAADPEDSINEQNLDSEATLKIFLVDDHRIEPQISLKISATNSEYRDWLKFADICIAVPGSPLPAKFSSLLQYLGQDRDDLTLDPGKIAFYNGLVRAVGNENEMQGIVATHIIGDSITSQDHLLVCNRPWLRTIRFSEQLGVPQPDLTYGLSSEPLVNIHKQSIGSEGRFCLSFQPLQDIGLPGLCFELKGPRGVWKEAYHQNQHNGACAVRNIVTIKRAAKRAPRTFVGRILALGIEITTETARVSCHWMTTANGKDKYWSQQVGPTVAVEDQSQTQRLVRNALKWYETLTLELRRDLEVLEKHEAMLGSAQSPQLHNPGSRKHSRSPSEKVEPTIERSRKKRRDV